MPVLGLFDIAVIAAYLLCMFGMGLYAMRRRGSLEDYYVGGRSSGSFVLGCLWMSSWIGGATVVGSVDKAHSIGLSAIWYCISMALGCVVFAKTSTGLIQRLGAKFQCLTYPEIIEKRYGAPARLIATVTTFLAYVAYTAGQFLAMALILVNFMHIDSTTAVWISAASMVAYTALGGFAAVRLTGVVQALAILVAIVGIMLPVVWSQAGGLPAVSAALPESFMDIGAWGWGKIAGLTVTIILTFYTSMDSYTRCFAAKSEASARCGTLIAAVMVAVMALGTTAIGMAAKVLVPQIPSGGTVVGSLLLQSIPVGLRGLILVGLLAAIMSTGSACLLVASANMTRDIFQRFAAPNASHRTLVIFGSLSSVLVGILAAYLAIAKKDVIDVLYIAFTINSASLFIPTLAAFVWKKGGARVAAASMACSLAVVIYWYMAQAWYPNSAVFAVDPVWPGLAASLVAFVPGALWFPLDRREQNRLDIFWRDDPAFPQPQQ